MPVIKEGASVEETTYRSELIEQLRHLNCTMKEIACSLAIIAKCCPVPSSIKIVVGESVMGMKIKGCFCPPGAKRKIKAGAPISLTALVAAGGSLNIEVDDQNGHPIPGIDPSTTTGDLTTDASPATLAVVTKTDPLHFSLAIDPTLGSSGSTINLTDTLSFTSGQPAGPLSDTEQLLCDLPVPPAIPTTVKIVIG